MEEIMPSTGDVLLVQFIRQYGTANMSSVAQGIQSNPLLQNNAHEWTEDYCAQRIHEIEKREGLSVSKDLQQLFTRLRASRIQGLKQAIRQDELRYDQLRNVIQEEEERARLTAVEKEIERPVSPKDTSMTMEEAKTEEVHEHMEVDEPAQAESTVKEPTPEVIPNDTAATESESNPEPAAPPENTQTVKEDKQELERARLQKEKEEQEEEAQAIAQVKPESPIHRTRSRSNTLNTAVSIDESIHEEPEVVESVKRRPGRPRTTKRQSSVASPSGSKNDRPAVEMTSEQQASHKRFQSSITPVLNNIAAHKYASIFQAPVLDRDAPNYSKMIKEPTNLRLIKSQVKSGEITDSGTFHVTVLKMLANAVMFNPEHSGIVQMARDLYDATEMFVEIYKSAEQAIEEDEPTPKRRRRV